MTSVSDTFRARRNYFNILNEETGGMLLIYFVMITGRVPEYNWMLLIGMACAGVLGAVIGRKINRKFSTAAVDKLFQGLIIVFMAICVYNLKNICRNKNKMQGK